MYEEEDAVAPFHETPFDQPSPKKTRTPNVGRRERTVSTAFGAGMALAGLVQLLRGRPVAGLLLVGGGGLLAQRGTSGFCRVYNALGYRADDADESSHPFNRFVHAARAVTVQRPPEEVFGFWRDYDNLPRIMPNLDHVEDRGATSHWTAEAPGGRRVSWEAMTVEERPNECIAWRSLDDADFQHHGVVTFRPAPGGRGTEVHVAMSWRPPAGIVGALAAKLSVVAPEMQLDKALRRMKQLLEAGEIATGESTSARDSDRRERTGEGSEKPAGGRIAVRTRPGMASVDEFTDVAPPPGERFGEAAS